MYLQCNSILHCGNSKSVTQLLEIFDEILYCGLIIHKDKLPLNQQCFLNAIETGNYNLTKITI